MTSECETYFAQCNLAKNIINNDTQYINNRVNPESNVTRYEYKWLKSSQCRTIKAKHLIKKHGIKELIIWCKPFSRLDNMCKKIIPYCRLEN